MHISPKDLPHISSNNLSFPSFAFLLVVAWSQQNVENLGEWKLYRIVARSKFPLQLLPHGKSKVFESSFFFHDLENTLFISSYIRTYLRKYVHVRAWWLIVVANILSKLLDVRISCSICTFHFYIIPKCLLVSWSTFARSALKLAIPQTTLHYVHKLVITWMHTRSPTTSKVSLSPFHLLGEKMRQFAPFPSHLWTLSGIIHLLSATATYIYVSILGVFILTTLWKNYEMVPNEDAIV